MLACLPGPAFSITGRAAVGSARGAAASHRGQGGTAPAAEEERRSDAPSPRTAGAAAARVGDNKLRERVRIWGLHWKKRHEVRFPWAFRAFEDQKAAKCKAGFQAASAG